MSEVTDRAENVAELLEDPAVFGAQRRVVQHVTNPQLELGNRQPFVERQQRPAVANRHELHASALCQDSVVWHEDDHALAKRGELGWPARRVLEGCKRRPRHGKAEIGIERV